MKCPMIKKCGGCFYPQDQYQEELKEKTLFIEKEVQKAKLKIEHDGELVRYDTIVNKIMSYSEEKIKNVNELYDILIENNVKDRKTKKEHIKNIKTNVDKKDISKCPKCGGTLVERESIYGKFIGCSNYPQCKYTRKK